MPWQNVPRSGTDFFETDAHIELFLYDIAFKVIHHFQNEIVHIKRKKNVTFKYVGEAHDAAFN